MTQQGLERVTGEDEKEGDFTGNDKALLRADDARRVEVSICEESGRVSSTQGITC
jgi:hypothetical protein